MQLALAVSTKGGTPWYAGTYQGTTSSYHSAEPSAETLVPPITVIRESNGLTFYSYTILRHRSRLYPRAGLEVYYFITSSHEHHLTNAAKAVVVGCWGGMVTGPILPRLIGTSANLRTHVTSHSNNKKKAKQTTSYYGHWHCSNLHRSRGTTASPLTRVDARPILSDIQSRDAPRVTSHPTHPTPLRLHDSESRPSRVHHKCFSTDSSVCAHSTPLPPSDFIPSRLREPTGHPQSSAVS